jgi:hypothetical protein
MDAYSMTKIFALVTITVLFAAANCETNKQAHRSPTDLAVRVRQGSVGMGKSLIVDFLNATIYTQSLQNVFQNKHSTFKFPESINLNKLRQYAIELYYADSSLRSAHKEGIVCAWQVIEILIDDSLVSYNGFYTEEHPYSKQIEGIVDITKLLWKELYGKEGDSTVTQTRFTRFDKY